jgi:hypothetical protein
VPEKYFFLIPIIRDIADSVNNTNFCEYGMTIEGVLENAIRYYLIEDAN